MTEPESAVFRCHGGFVRLDIPALGTPSREWHDQRVARGDLEQVADDAVVEVVEVYGRDKEGNELTSTRLVAAPVGDSRRGSGRQRNAEATTGE